MLRAIKKYFTDSKRQANLRTGVLVLVLAGIVIVGLGAKVYAEQVGSSPSNGSTSRIKSLYDTLQTSGYGSDSDTPSWGTSWNRIKTAATWEPNGTVTSADVLSGKTFFNGNRTQQTGSLSLTGTATPADVVSGKTFYSNSTTQQTGTASTPSAGNCPTQQYHDSYGAPVTQTTNCTASIAWTTPSDGVTGTDKRDPVSGLIWSQALLNSGGTVTFTTGGPSTWSWDATAANNVAVGTKTAKQLCSDRGNGWRLPTQKELMQAYIDGSYFNLSQPSLNFWSATQYSSTNAWYVALSNGNTNVVNMGNTYNVRCVR